MGQYYKFINTTKQIESIVSLPFNFGLPWAKNLESYSQEELKEKFEYVRKNNNWSENDEVIALGDYGNILYYPKD
ncbi:hypothetical protein [Tolypothrix sp. VBCCA 56010]|uniref:hypothetical protein n=1 Tax=Tolypothrix sp. VBCCA 56010 TaxID=3137731 RepID=UPI003D7CABE1